MRLITYDLSRGGCSRSGGDLALRKMRRRAPMIYLFGYFYGATESADAEMDAARRVLLDEGCEAGVINLPCGHGGNALNPGDPAIDLTIGKGWRMRVNSDGLPCPTTTCIDERMIADSRAANERYRQMGFSRLINDDDLRLGRWGRNLQGCYCERCMAEFSARVGGTVGGRDCRDRSWPRRGASIRRENPAIPRGDDARGMQNASW